MGSEWAGVLRAIASALQTPVIIILLILMAVALILVGSLIAEFILRKQQKKLKITALIEQFRQNPGQELAILQKGGILKRQRVVCQTLLEQANLDPKSLESLARRLLAQEQNQADRIIQFSDFVAKLAPMFGLMGTLIPLGPGLIALGQGDTYTLSASLLIAFDTTTAGLISAALGYVISSMRRRWYEDDLSALEMLLEYNLEVGNHAKPAEE